MGLAVALIPLIPALVKGLLDVYDALMTHGDLTPEQKTQMIVELRALNVRIQATALPN